MKRLLIFALFSLICLVMIFFYPKKDPAAEFLNALSEEQRSLALLPFDSPKKTDWHFFPSTMFEREGISLKDLSTEQQDKAFAMLRHYLSKSGYDKTRKIMDLESVLREFSGDSVNRDPEKYFFSFYGQPTDDLWAWSFEGHHVSLNFTVKDQEITSTPRFLGSNPAQIPSGDRAGERTLHREEDLGFELINSMSPDQQRQAIFQEESFKDIVTLNLPAVDPLSPEGIRYQELNPSQQRILSDLIDEYLGTLPKKLHEQRKAQIVEEGLEHIYFGWVGAKSPGAAHYYRVQGKSFLIEFDNSQTNANHIHTVWRDFEGDFGRDLIKEHYQNSEHHHGH
ncbi:DUF3500 domain-containing protein [Algoriphagus namhaensis]